jgi:hypothetical protein
MPRGRGPSTFKQRDLTAALKSARDAGVSLARIEVGKDGRIILIPGEPTSEHDPDVANDWDDAR